ncbi:unnamed protein product [Linum tenue]|uniref:Uncharacterized protein n=1 Tax=Linum tenue TaxID=586396 RepID=A0AAV0K1V5_9ROSI|nr:unnamed protein product [Linum tenue]
MYGFEISVGYNFCFSFEISMGFCRLFCLSSCMIYCVVFLEFVLVYRCSICLSSIWIRGRLLWDSIPLMVKLSCILRLLKCEL